MKKVLGVACAVSLLALVGCNGVKKSATVKVGILHSLTGTMAISESPVHDSELLAIS